MLRKVETVGKVTYKTSGVDIAKKAAFVKSIYERMRATFDDRVIENKGGFGALFSLDYDRNMFRRNYRHPVLVASTDGVGTKLKVAFMAGRHDTIGIDLVAMCVNDVLVQGATPLFFLDYLASSSIEPQVLAEVVSGIAAGCEESRCSLVGGETPEMPGFYTEGEYDIAGFVVGVVEKNRLITGAGIEPGDAVIGLSSSGLHSNGYSLVRKVIFETAGLEVGDSLARYGINRTVGDELLEPTRIYVRPVEMVLNHYSLKQPVHGIAHITGGGLVENIERILPKDVNAVLRRSLWEMPPIFSVIQSLGGIEENEMLKVFNMGIGMVLIVSPFYAESIIEQLERAGETAQIIGEVGEGNGAVAIK